MRITAYNLLTEGLGAELDKQKATRNAMDNLVQCIDALNPTLDAIGRDQPVNGHPAIAPTK